MEIEKETFKAIQALSDIQKNLSEGLAMLKTLKETTEEYMVFREKEAEERVAKVLKESCNMLEDISKNYNQLSLYRDELKAYAVTIKNASDVVVVLFENFRSAMDKSDEDMKVHYNSVKETLKDIKIEGSKIDSDRKQLKVEHRRIEDETRLLVDRRGTLERAFEEVKRLKEKQKN